MFTSCRARRSRRRRGSSGVDPRRRRQHAGANTLVGSDPGRVRSCACRNRDPLGYLGRTAHLRREAHLDSFTPSAGHKPTTTATCCCSSTPSLAAGAPRSTAKHSCPGIGSCGRWGCTTRAIWYEQTAGFRANLDAFAAGINAYAERYPDRLDTAARTVLPVTGADVLAHVARIFFCFSPARAARSKPC